MKQASETPEHCPDCGKTPALCICDRVAPAEISLRIIILQHPQENDATLGTAPLVALTLPQAEIRTGLSWPSLAAVLDTARPDPKRWAVLATAKLPEAVLAAARRDHVALADRHGRVLDIRGHQLEGLLVLDGSWGQAKTLWWRNPWLLKLPRLALMPREPSMYGRLRREPHRDRVSTLEAIADVLPALGEPEAVRDNLRRLFRTLLQRARDAGYADTRRSRHSSRRKDPQQGAADTAGPPTTDGRPG